MFELLVVNWRSRVYTEFFWFFRLLWGFVFSFCVWLFCGFFFMCLCVICFVRRILGFVVLGVRCSGNSVDLDSVLRSFLFG